MTPADDTRSADLSARLTAARDLLNDNMARLQDSCAELRSARDMTRSGRSRRETLHESAYARLRERLLTMPVIEQAKGVLIEQTGCPPETAFDMLRRASQRSNIPVRQLAETIVARRVDGDGSGVSAAAGSPAPTGEAVA
jgi:AmiR/NasT family two-component response regulator